MTTPFFIDAAAVAQLIDLPDGDALLRRRQALQAQGFPAPLPWSARPLKWSRAAVLAWAERQSMPDLGTAQNVVPLSRLMQLARQG